MCGWVEDDILVEEELDFEVVAEVGGLWGDWC